MRLEGMACHHLCLQFLGPELSSLQSLQLTRAGSKEMPSSSPQQAGTAAANQQLHQDASERIVCCLAQAPCKSRSRASQTATGARKRQLGLNVA